MPTQNKIEDQAARFLQFAFTPVKPIIQANHCGKLRIFIGQESQLYAAVQEMATSFATSLILDRRC